MAGLQKLIRKSFTNDLTACSIPRGILGLAIPMITASIFQSFQSLVDMYFVGKLGPAAVASVGMAGMISGVAPASCATAWTFDSPAA